VSKTLIWREVRRQAPGALFLLALFTLGRIPEELSHELTNPNVLALCGMVFGALAGVVTLAPDTARGGTAFLFRMPVTPGRIAIAKLVALATYLPGFALLLLAAHAETPLLEPAVGYDGAVWTPGIGKSVVVLSATGIVLGLSFGLVASVVMGRTIPALLLAPILAGVSFFALSFGPALTWDLEPLGFYFVLLPLLSGVALWGAWLAFTRGDPHRESPRPALYAAAVVAPAVAVLFGGTGIAQAWTRSSIEEHLRVSARASVASPDGQHLAVELYAQPWSGLDHHVAVVDRDRGEQWVLPHRDVWEPTFSPDGRWLLVRNYRQPGGFLVDVEARTTQALPGRSRDGFGYRFVSWTADGPLFVEQAGGSIRSWLAVPGDPDDPLRQDPRAAARESFYVQSLPRTLVAVSGDQALLTDAQGLWHCPVPRRVTLDRGGAQAALELPEPQATLLVSADLAQVKDAELSPLGDYLVTVVDKHLRVFDLTNGTLTLDWPRSPVWSLNSPDCGVSFDPTERRLAAYGAGDVEVKDLATGRSPSGLLAGQPGVRLILSWTPDGEQLAINAFPDTGSPEPTARIYPLDTPGAVLPLGSQAVTGFVSERQMLVAQQPFGVLRLTSARTGKDQ